jgi:hypothetical protein
MRLLVFITGVFAPAEDSLRGAHPAKVEVGPGPSGQQLTLLGLVA